MSDSGLGVLASRSDPPPPPRRRRRRRRSGPRVAILLLVLALVGGVTGGLVYAGSAVRDSLRSQPVADFPGPGAGEAVITIEPGQTAAQIATTLVTAGVVRSEEAFRAVAAEDERSRRLQPGRYRVRKQMAAGDALALLLDPDTRLVGRVVLPEGTELPRALELLASGSKIPLAQLRAAAARPATLGLPAYAGNRLEGFLFPATYEVEPGTTAVELLRTLVARYVQAAQEVGLEARAAALGVTPYAAVTIASLVEGETGKDADRPKVARVVYNRLGDDMKLDFDSTVKYALLLRGERKTRILQADTRIESPYNTYVTKGLPPTPISSPGEQAMRAALNPEPGRWRYFVVSSKDGSSAFAETFAEHQRNVARYRSEVQGGG